MVTFLVGASSEVEDSSSDDSSLESSLELDAAAVVTFVGAAFTGSDFAGADFDCVGFVVVVPFVATLGGAPLAGAALPAGNGGSSSESSLSESSSLSLSLTGFARALGGGCFEGTAFEKGLVAPVLVAVVVGSSSDSLSLDSEEELALAGTALDCYKKNEFCITRSKCCKTHLPICHRQFVRRLIIL